MDLQRYLPLVIQNGTFSLMFLELFGIFLELFGIFWNYFLALFFEKFQMEFFGIFWNLFDLIKLIN